MKTFEQHWQESKKQVAAKYGSSGLVSSSLINEAASLLAQSIREEYEIENKYHFAREVIFNLRSCHAINDEVYSHWIDKLNKDEKASKNQTE